MSLILTCPECATRYVAKAESLVAPGRTVRCSRCEHTWFQEIEAPEAAEGYETLFEEFEAEPQTSAPEAAPVREDSYEFDAQQTDDKPWDDPQH